MEQYISYINYGNHISNVGKQGYTPFPEDLNPIFAKSNENVNKIFDNKTEKGNITTNIKGNKTTSITKCKKSK